MFENVLSTQVIADQVKAIALEAKSVSKRKRRDLLFSIGYLEGCGWHPQMMADAFEHFEHPGVEANTDGIVLVGDIDTDLLVALDDLIWQYLDIYDGNLLNQIYDMHEAAEYLGIGYDMMKKYVSRQRRLRGKKIGRSMIFTQAQLDRFKQTMRKPGRPVST